MGKTIDTTVLIIGGGPVGHGLALDLGQRGIACLLVEEGDGAPGHPKLGTVAVRTMEIFRRWGIAHEVETAGFPPDYELSNVYCTSLAGWVLEKDFYPSQRDTPTPAWSPQKRQRCPQQFLEPVLRRAVADTHSATVRLRCRMTGFTQFDDHVEARVHDLETDESFAVRAAYMVGCDGAASQVRTQLGIAMEGDDKLNYSIGIQIRSKDLLKHFSIGEAERYLFIGPEGTWGNITVVDGADIWRLNVFGSAVKFDLKEFDARYWADRALGRSDIPYDIPTVAPWRRAELTAATYRAGRVFLAGDSAHVMSPTAGMGMNTGIADALDLSWKLAAVLQGWGGPQLLDTYTSERRPVAVRNAAFATHNWKAWIAPSDCSAVLDDSPAGAATRQRIGDELKTNLKDEWSSWGVQMGYRYEGSPICIADGTPPPPDHYSIHVPTARPGSLAPHAWLAPGRSTIDLFGQGFTLLAFAGAPEGSVAALRAAAAARGVPLAVEEIAAADIAALYEQPLVLVRPDGHVAWRGGAVADAAGIIDTVRGAAAA